MRNFPGWLEAKDKHINARLTPGQCPNCRESSKAWRFNRADPGLWLGYCPVCRVLVRVWWQDGELIEIDASHKRKRPTVAV